MSIDKAIYNLVRRGIMPTLQGGVGGGPISINSEGAIMRQGVGREFFVAGNWGSDSNEGDSWDAPFLTLAAAITANNADVAADKYGWATRNRIYISADTTTETLVAFPNKCDVIGVGSYDANDKPGITGLHAPVNAGNYGTRFYNIWFKATAVASPIVTLASTSSGCQFIGCTFDGAAGTTTMGISATASPFLKVIDCEFFGPFATGYILFGAGEAASTVIEGCKMGGSSGYGVKFTSTTTSSYPSYVKDNIISVVTTGIVLDDDSDLIYTVGNRGANAATLNNYAGRTGICDLNEDRAIDNIFTGADISVRVPLITVT
jgi:hypothetical protein